MVRVIVRQLVVDSVGCPLASDQHCSSIPLKTTFRWVTPRSCVSVTQLCIDNASHYWHTAEGLQKPYMGEYTLLSDKNKKIKISKLLAWTDMTADADAHTKPAAAAWGWAASATLTKDKVVRPEELSEGAGADRVHGAWLQVHQDGSGDVLPTWWHKLLKIWNNLHLRCALNTFSNTLGPLNKRYFMVIRPL